MCFKCVERLVLEANNETNLTHNTTAASTINTTATTINNSVPTASTNPDYIETAPQRNDTVESLPNYETANNYSPQSEMPPPTYNEATIAK